MISVCFRFDDPSPASDHALETNIVEILQRYEAPASFAVIPCCSSNNEGRLIRWSVGKAKHLVEAADKGIIEIAQHGTTHTRVSETESGAPSEFYGMPFSQQISRIEEGLKELRSVFRGRIDGFVPPWNTYDSSTAKAAEALGFSYLSPSLEVLKNRKLFIIPKTCNLLEAKSAIEEAIRFEALNPAVVIVFHPYQFEEFHKPPAPGERPPFTNLKDFDALLHWIQSKENVKVKTLRELAADNLLDTPFWRFQDIRFLDHLPYRIGKHLPKKILIQRKRMISFFEIARTLLK